MLCFSVFSVEGVVNDFGVGLFGLLLGLLPIIRLIFSRFILLVKLAQEFLLVLEQLAIPSFFLMVLQVKDVRLGIQKQVIGDQSVVDLFLVVRVLSLQGLRLETIIVFLIFSQQFLSPFLQQ